MSGRSRATDRRRRLQDELTDARVVTYLTPREKARLRALARRAGLGPGKWIQRQVLSALKEREQGERTTWLQ